MMKSYNNDTKVFSYNDVVSILEKLQNQSYENRQSYIKNNGYKHTDVLNSFSVESDAYNKALFAFHNAFNKMTKEGK